MPLPVVLPASLRFASSCSGNLQASYHFLAFSRPPSALPLHLSAISRPPTASRCSPGLLVLCLFMFGRSPSLLPLLGVLPASLHFASSCSGTPPTSCHFPAFSRPPGLPPLCLFVFQRSLVILPLPSILPASFWFASSCSNDLLASCHFPIFSWPPFALPLHIPIIPRPPGSSRRSPDLPPLCLFMFQRSPSLLPLPIILSASFRFASSCSSDLPGSCCFPSFSRSPSSPAPLLTGAPSASSHLLSLPVDLPASL